jgi:membrane protease YdiL (CAAX protease family)
MTEISDLLLPFAAALTQIAVYISGYDIALFIENAFHQNRFRRLTSRSLTMLISIPICIAISLFCISLRSSERDSDSVSLSKIGFSTGTGWRNTIVWPLAHIFLIYMGDFLQFAMENTNPFDEIDDWISFLHGTIFAPAVEEIVFRGCASAAMVVCGWTKGQIILSTSLLFGAGM